MCQIKNKQTQQQQQMCFGVTRIWDGLKKGMIPGSVDVGGFSPWN